MVVMAAMTMPSAALRLMRIDHGQAILATVNETACEEDIARLSPGQDP